MNQTTFLFIFPIATKPANADKAPISKAIANVKAKLNPFDKEKKLITCIVLTTLTIIGTNKKEIIIVHTIFDSLQHLIFFLGLWPSCHTDSLGHPVSVLCE